MPDQGTPTSYPEKMTRLVIFDLDGTLLDTSADIANSCNYALRMCGFPERTLEEYNMLVGRGIYNLLRDAMPQEHRNEDMTLKMADHFIPYYNEHIADYSRPYPGITELLERLSERGIAFAIASNKYQEGTEKLVKEQLGKFNFVSVLGHRDGKPLKPDPAIILDSMQAIDGIVPEEVVYCGDSDVDMKTGNNAGVRTIGVSWGFRSRKELLAYSPWLIAESPEEIYAAVTADPE